MKISFVQLIFCLYYIKTGSNDDYAKKTRLCPKKQIELQNLFVLSLSRATCEENKICNLLFKLWQMDIEIKKTSLKYSEANERLENRDKIYNKEGVGQKVKMYILTLLEEDIMRKAHREAKIYLRRTCVCSICIDNLINNERNSRHNMRNQPKPEINTNFASVVAQMTEEHTAKDIIPSENINNPPQHASEMTANDNTDNLAHNMSENIQNTLWDDHQMKNLNKLVETLAHSLFTHKIFIFAITFALKEQTKIEERCQKNFFFTEFTNENDFTKEKDITKQKDFADKLSIFRKNLDLLADIEMKKIPKECMSNIINCYNNKSNNTNHIENLIKMQVETYCCQYAYVLTDDTKQALNDGVSDTNHDLLRGMTDDEQIMKGYEIALQELTEKRETHRKHLNKAFDRMLFYYLFCQNTRYEVSVQLFDPSQLKKPKKNPNKKRRHN